MASLSVERRRGFATLEFSLKHPTVGRSAKAWGTRVCYPRIRKTSALLPRITWVPPPIYHAGDLI